VSCCGWPNCDGDCPLAHPLAHPLGYELFVIGQAQEEGSKKQRAVYTLARWLFVQGDGAIIPRPPLRS